MTRHALPLDFRAADQRRAAILACFEETGAGFAGSLAWPMLSPDDRDLSLPRPIK
jgi:hypothetical protein